MLFRDIELKKKKGNKEISFTGKQSTIFTWDL